MVDYFTLALSHGLLIIALWRIVQRDDLDRDPEDAPQDRRPAARRKARGDA